MCGCGWRTGCGRSFADKGHHRALGLLFLTLQIEIDFLEIEVELRSILLPIPPYLPDDGILPRDLLRALHLPLPAS